MGKIIKVTLEYEDEIKTIEGEGARLWLDNIIGLCTTAHIHNINPFDKRPTQWTVIPKEDKS